MEKENVNATEYLKKSFHISCLGNLNEDLL
jgi:hypothetical protein